MAELVERTGSVTGRACLAYTRGECRAERGDPDAARYLQEAVAMAEEAELWFVAGIARHTLLTSAARAAADPAAALPTFGPLLDHWHGFGAWTQLWMAMRALAETLSRLGRHREAAVLLGALRRQPARRRGCTGPTPRGSGRSRPRRATALGDAVRGAAGPRGRRWATPRRSPSPAGSPGPAAPTADPAYA